MNVRLAVAALATAPLVLATPATAAPVVPVPELFTGIRPGSHMVAPRGCTVGFVLQDAAGAFDPTQNLYLSVAKHCVDHVGQPVRLAVRNPVTGQDVEVEVGTVSYLAPVDDV